MSFLPLTNDECSVSPGVQNRVSLVMSHEMRSEVDLHRAGCFSNDGALQQAR